MPVMKRLTVDGVNYDTVGEASVTQVQTSGTKIATVTIDGTATDLYAPEGGGGGSTVTVTPILTSGTQTATISVDGTTSTLYAPTPPTVDNTPTQSSSNPVSSGGVYDLIHYYDNGNYGITTVGMSGSDYVQFAGEPRYNNSALATTAQVSAKQDALVSGTNIKTVNGTSILGSGNISTVELPTVTASDNGKVLQVVSGAWAAASLPSANGVSF